MAVQEMQEFKVWDRSVRLFHWINVVCVFLMIVIGLLILNGKYFGMSNDGKVMMKTIHVMVGYVFSLNLLWRIIWGFIGGKFSRWGRVLPGGKGYGAALGAYHKSIASDKPQYYQGHNPMGRIAVSFLLLLLTSQMISGLVLAGTDIYYPPLGSWIAEWIAAPGVNPAELVPYSPDLYNPDAVKEMRAFRSPYITLHVWGFYAISVMVVLHIAAMVFTEVKVGGGIISAMFTGKKYFPEKPMDEE